MADLITLARAVPLKGTGGASYYQALTEAIDVSAYDSIDFSINATSDQGSGVKIYILTSIQNKIDDIAAGTNNPSWYSLGEVSLTSANAGVPIFKAMSVPQSSTAAPMLRWIRYQIDLLSTTTNTSFTIEGLARRGLRVG